jgi:hypothetical protein
LNFLQRITLQLHFERWQKACVLQASCARACAACSTYACGLVENLQSALAKKLKTESFL